MNGYTYADPHLAPSPVTPSDLNLLQQTLLWTDADDQALHQAGEVLRPQTDAVLDLWYGYVGSHAHLLHYFSHNGAPDAHYLAAVRERFGQWILDLCQKPKDQDWLNYQEEIALRHHAAKKNRTDGVDAAPIIHLRYLVAFIFPITATIKDFLAHKGHTPAEVDAMYQAWFKAVVLSATLWCRPYVKENEY